jgi:pimeloyl-ACP methyl ester carboxylesterase
MFIQVNGVKLYFDVEGSGLAADGPALREKPTLLLLHGGPGFDHALFKPAFSAFADIAQVVYYDHRGNGRSGGNDPADWNLNQWSDDVRALCDALGITRPIVFGHSFGGYVAQAYATRHPDHPAKLILANTTAKVEFEAVFAAFERRGGVEAGQIARDYWTAPDPERRAKFLEVCFPLYRFRPEINPSVNRSILKGALTLHFNGPHNEQGRLDFRADLAKVRCPTLVIGGEHDPVMPIACAETIAASLPPHLVRFERFADCGHLPWLDQQERAFAILRQFILTG